MATLSKTTQSRDPRGYITTEYTWESFDGEITPNPTARQWQQSFENSKHTLVETYINTVPDPGGGGGQTYPETWSIEVSTGSEPIEGHPNFGSNFTEAFWTKYRLWKNGQPSPADWTPATAGTLGVRLMQYINQGITSYLSPKIVIKHTYSSTSAPDLAAVGMRNFPSFAGGLTPEGVDFIVTGASCVQEGPTFRISYEWLGSALGGWDQYLYAEAGN